MSSELFDFELRMNTEWQNRVDTMPAPLAAWIDSKNAEINYLLSWKGEVDDEALDDEVLTIMERQREEEIERLLCDEEVEQIEQIEHVEHLEHVEQLVEEPPNYICYGEEITVGQLLTLLHVIVTENPNAAFKPIFHESALKSWLG